jgi:hypothetical protein
MFEIFNNSWLILICGFLIYSIYKKIKNLNKPIEETKFIEQFKNQQKLKKNFNLNNIVTRLPDVASYYVGIN